MGREIDVKKDVRKEESGEEIRAEPGVLHSSSPVVAYEWL